MANKPQKILINQPINKPIVKNIINEHSLPEPEKITEEKVVPENRIEIQENSNKRISLPEPVKFTEEKVVQNENRIEVQENKNKEIKQDKREIKNNEHDFLYSVDDIPSPKRMILKSLQNKDVRYCVKKTIENIEKAVKKGKTYAPIYSGGLFDEIIANEDIILNLFKECGYREYKVFPSGLASLFGDDDDSPKCKCITWIE